MKNNNPILKNLEKIKNNKIYIVIGHYGAHDELEIRAILTECFELENFIAFAARAGVSTRPGRFKSSPSSAMTRTSWRGASLTAAPLTVVPL